MKFNQNNNWITMKNLFKNLSGILLVLIVLFGAINCLTSFRPYRETKSDDSLDKDLVSCKNVKPVKPPVSIVDTLNLRIYYPNYSKVDLVCGKMPSKDDQSVIMFAEAAFTGEYLKEFKHSNIAGDHVSEGKRQKGYKCKRNNGAFVFFNGKPKFLYEAYSEELDNAALNGGCGFAQEMMIHNSSTVPHTRSNRNSNEFRALCLIAGKLAVVDSKGVVKFGDFIRDLKKAGVTEALYLDMGPGWNYSWYRDEKGNPIEIHSLPTKYATNWITFYR